jgi:hypothetical protein
VLTQLGEEVLDRLERTIVQTDDDVAGDDSRPVRRTAFDQLLDEDARVAAEIESVVISAVT